MRLVDPLIGEAVGMRVDVDLEDGTTAAGLFVHKLLSESVGCGLSCCFACHAPRPMALQARIVSHFCSCQKVLGCFALLALVVQDIPDSEVAEKKLPEQILVG